MAAPEIVLIVSTFEKPAHLARVLCSIGCQQQVDGLFEVVVTDDGSTDETSEVVERFAQQVDFPVKFITHPHSGFQVSRCRNEGVASSTAPYVLFLDGDCVIPPDHLSQHLSRRKKNTIMSGFCCRLDESTTNRIDESAIRSGEYLDWAPASELRTLRKQDVKSRFYSLIRHPTKPKLFGGNIAMWREDLQRINGFDEKFVGWGCEDDDLRLRARQAGLHIKSVLRWTHTMHLWHEPYSSKPTSWREGTNTPRIKRPYRFTRCLNGLQKRHTEEIALGVVNAATHCHAIERLPVSVLQSIENNLQPEVEILIRPGSGDFSDRADCNILVMLDASHPDARDVMKAHVVMTSETSPSLRTGQLAFSELDQVLHKVA